MRIRMIMIVSCDVSYDGNVGQKGRILSAMESALASAARTAAIQMAKLSQAKDTK